MEGGLGGGVALWGGGGLGPQKWSRCSDAEVGGLLRVGGGGPRAKAEQGGKVGGKGGREKRERETVASRNKTTHESAQILLRSASFICVTWRGWGSWRAQASRGAWM